MDYKWIIIRNNSKLIYGFECSCVYGERHFCPICNANWLWLTLTRTLTVGVLGLCIRVPITLPLQALDLRAFVSVCLFTELVERRPTTTTRICHFIISLISIGVQEHMFVTFIQTLIHASSPSFPHFHPQSSFKRTRDYNSWINLLRHLLIHLGRYA